MKKRIAVLCCGWSTYFVTDFLNGILKITKENNIDVYVFNAYNYVEFSGFPNFSGFSIYSLIHYENFDGVIILSDLIGNVRVLEKERLRILKSGIPAICINHSLQGMSCLKVDNYSGFQALINHLIRMHGVKDLAYISGSEKSIDFAERYKAYRECLKENEIPFNPEKVHTISRANYNVAYAYVNEYIKSEKPLPEAFVCANDLIALAVLKVAEENNIKVPDQLKIIGYDDIFYAECLSPSISSVSGKAELVGAEAVKRLLSEDRELKNISVKSFPVYRNSCGCAVGMSKSHKMFALNVLNSMNTSDEFTTQMEVMEEIFTESNDVFTLLTSLESFFGKSHYFEGSDFSIFLKSDWSSVLINSEEHLPQNLSYGNNVQSIVSVHNDKKYINEVISTQDLIPQRMISEDTGDLYVFMPIFHHSYVFGYLVTKNSLKLIDNHYGYTWTKTFGTCIERFRKKNMYKQLSQQFLKYSTMDQLSGCLNRVGMEKIVIPYYNENKNKRLTNILYFVDINKMKHINDNFGHLHGDLAVKTVAAAILQVVPKNWKVVRYGGDEFLVLGSSYNYKGEDYCKLITETLNKKVALMKLPYKLSASAGTYQVMPDSPLTLQQAVEKVDEIMYIQKEQMHKLLEEQAKAKAQYDEEKKENE